MWKWHDQQMLKLKKIYLKTSKQTQIRIQEIFNSIDYDFNNLYSIANLKTKKMINTYIEEWQDKGLLKGEFGRLAKNIYNRTRVNNNEILELLIYGAYIEEQNKLNEKELNIFKEDANYYYNQGINEVRKAQGKKEAYSMIPDAIFLALLSMPNVKGYVYHEYIEAILKYNADQIYRQAIIDIQQQKELKIDSDVYKNIIKKQQNQKLCINEDKISGNVDLTLIGINNNAKVEGIKKEDNDARVIFLANLDGKETDMCHSLNNQIFYIDKINEFNRYFGETQKDLAIKKIKCKGLVLGLNLPPISHHFHYCRSMVQYIPPKNEKKSVLQSNIKKRIKNPLNRNLLKYNTKHISKLALLQNLRKANKVMKDFSVLNNKIKNIKVKSNTDYIMAIKPMKNVNGFNLYIDKGAFNSIRNARQSYKELVQLGQAPKGTTYKDILNHELGHAVTYEIIKKSYKGEYDLIQKDWNNSITATNIVNKAFKNMNINDVDTKIKVVKNLSKYAYDANSSEMIAEAFADYYCNGSKAQKISREIINIMKGMV